MNKITVIDSLMGSGKTEFAIKEMKRRKDERFIYITPYLEECDRIKKALPHFKEPRAIKGSKLDGIRKLLSEGESIVSTHSLLKRFDLEIQEYILCGDYTLILDEVLDVVTTFNFKNKTEEEVFFKDFGYIGDDNYICWREDKYPSHEYQKQAPLYEVKTLCDNKNLVKVDNKLLMWELPAEVFKQFHEVQILTYMFQGSYQKAYFDSFNINYEYLTIEDNKTVPYKKTTQEQRNEWKKLINLVDNKKLNAIGDNTYALTSSWFQRESKKGEKGLLMKKLKTNTSNFFKHICKGKSQTSLWTTFKQYKSTLSGLGYTKGFIPFNLRATNQYAHKRDLAYLCNIYPHTSMKIYFREKGISLDEDAYALSLLLQWIWRSRIRDSKLHHDDRKINLYIPSKRMRTFFIKWLEGEI